MNDNRLKIMRHKRVSRPFPGSTDDLNERMKELNKRVSDQQKALETLLHRDRSIERQQLNLMKSERRKERLQSTAKAVQSGLKFIAAKPISRADLTRKMYSMEYLDKTAPRRR